MSADTDNDTVAPDTPLWVAARILLTDHQRHFFTQWKKTAKNFDEEEVHDLRVASRRLREGLALFAPCLPGSPAKSLRKRLKLVTDLLGGLRNADEAYLFFSQLADSAFPKGEELGRLREFLREERREEHRKVKAGFEALSPEGLKSACRTLVQGDNLFVLGSTPFLSLGGLLPGAIDRRDCAVREHLPAALNEDQGPVQHRLRIAIKKLRYRLEIVEPLFGGGFDQLHDDLKGYQEILGKLHDMDVFVEMVRVRMAAGNEREAAVETIGRHRRELFLSFIEMTGKTPPDQLGARAKGLLRQPVRPRLS
ncbi:CHAD domain-containing protein [Geomonas sp. Red276]